MISAARCCVLVLPIQMLHIGFRVSEILKTFAKTDSAFHWYVFHARLATQEYYSTFSHYSSFALLGESVPNQENPDLQREAALH